MHGIRQRHVIGQAEIHVVTRRLRIAFNRAYKHIGIHRTRRRRAESLHAHRRCRCGGGHEIIPDEQRQVALVQR